MGRFSLAPGDGVQALIWHCRFVFQPAAVVAIPVFHELSQPVSNEPGEPLLASPEPPFRWACLPLPAGGIQPPTTAFANCRNRPIVVSYLSRRKLLTVAGDDWVV